MLLMLLSHMVQCFDNNDTQTDHQPYPTGVLPCKLFNVTSLDCSQRKLQSVPPLPKNVTKLWLNHNKIANVSGTPFVNVTASLQVLNLIHNVIHTLESYVFKGLTQLRVLDLSYNQIVTLPDGLFNDLLQLRTLQMNTNRLEHIPNQALAPLISIEKIAMVSNYFRSVQIGTAFQNFTRLHTFAITNSWLQPYKVDLDGSFQYLKDCKFLKTLILHVQFKHPLPSNIFQHLSHLNALYLSSIFEFEDFASLGSPLQTLDIYPLSLPSTITNDTLQPLSKWNSTLSELRLKAGTLVRIEDKGFAWIPSLLNLDLSYNSLNYLSDSAFNGLRLLEVLNLAHNSLTTISYETFQEFRNSKSLNHLDLSSNQLVAIESDWRFLQRLITPSLKVFNIDGNYAVLLNTSVLASLENLTEVILKIKDVIPSSPVYSLRTLQLQAYSTPYMTLSPYSFQTSICTFAPFLERALLPNILIRQFVDVIGNTCSHLIELDISGCLAEYTTQPSIHVPKLTTLKMSNNKVTSLNQIIFIKSPPLLHLDLSFNDLSNIGNNFEYLLQNLLSLNLEGNKLTSIDGIRTLIFLRYLNLAQNQITYVPSDIRMNTTVIPGSDTSQTAALDLSGNPFQCTCDIESFREWITIDNMVHLLPNRMYTCTTPDSQNGLSVTEVALDCRSHLAGYIGTGLTCVLFMISLAIFVVKYRWHIKYKLFLLYNSQRIKWRNMDDHYDVDLDENRPDGNLYDAYVSYNDNCRQDIEWIINDLRPNMEDDYTLKLCIKDRDFIGGRDIADEICQNIQKSRKTLLILTPRFVESEWCHFEMKMAQMRLFDENRDVIILVLLEEIPDTLLTISLRQLFRDKEMLKFPHDNLGQHLFWRRLKAEILEPVIVDRRYDV